MKIKSVNEDHIIIEFSKTIDQETFNVITNYERAIKKLDGIYDVICSYNQIMVHYDDTLIDLEAVLPHMSVDQVTIEKNIVRIPVCYEEAYGLDLKEVCEIHSIKKEALIKMHTDNLYPVYMMGFVPGFPYLGHLNESLRTPRRKNPRVKMPKGAVGIGGEQTGIYPCASPGGWQIIGQTPLDLLDIKNSDTLIHRGDFIEFYTIDAATFEAIKGGDDHERN